ncbi:sugar phosphate isomerase/epimerase family protein [Haladaptatus pallidirubidus]|uniref:Sugar phosphate isomerase/epimerase n=1 Tax=Haladaptatus pallidirubidus TaxID=1008152 RepID=A0AAV3UPF8_9EURY|nr:sugar phosphate isomerase/epimerase family protein [Haladaptatus pallidirubidus]
MQLGLCTISNKEWDSTRIIRLASDLGFETVEIWGTEAHVGDGPSERYEEIRHAIRSMGLTYGSYLRPGTDSYDDEWKSELQIADQLGADIIRVWPGEQNYGEHTRDHWERTVDDLQHVARRAADRNLTVTVEKHGGTLTYRDEGAKKLIEAVDEHNCGLNWQPIFHDTAAEVLESAEWLAPLTNNVHLQAVIEREHPDGEKRNRCLLRDAYFDVEAVLDVFDSSGFDGVIGVEFVTPSLSYREAIANDYDYLQQALNTVG